MKITAIIAEYNPFHNGHAWQIRRIRESTGTDHILVIMSGDFVQRGAPAIIDKYSRTEMALLGGADAVIELPVRYACGSAEFFALGSVSILNALGCVDHLCFGCENADSIEDMKRIACVLNHPTHRFDHTLKNALRQGLSWPQARMQALYEINGCLDSSPEILTSPNNLLAIEYLRALEKLNSSIRPAAIRREGAGYHDTRIYTPSDRAGSYSFASASAAFSSASAIRKELLGSGLTPDAIASVPSGTQKILAQQYQNTSPILANDFSGVLHYLLLQKSAEDLCKYQDVTPDLANKILRNRNDFQNFDQFCMLLKSRNLTYSRIARSLMHIILGIPKSTVDEIRPEYARLLGFRKDSSALLSEIKKHSSIPLVTKPAGFGTDPTDSAASTISWREDVFAADLYTSVAAQKFGFAFKNEYQRQIVRI